MLDKYYSAVDSYGNYAYRVMLTWLSLLTKRFIYCSKYETYCFVGWDK